MSNNVLMRVAGVSGAAAVILGAMGAHALKNRNENMKDTWKIANNYHFIHTMALGLSAVAFTGKKRTYVCTLFTAGTVLFSGACYTIVLMDERKPFSNFAPIGGLMMMAGWLAIAII